MKPNYDKLGFTEIMGPKLPEFVKRSLVEDLQHYVTDETIINYVDCHFDWSDTCIEGHRCEYLDGKMENFSGINVYDKFDDLIAHGWILLRKI